MTFLIERWILNFTLFLFIFYYCQNFSDMSSFIVQLSYIQQTDFLIYKFLKYIYLSQFLNCLINNKSCLGSTSKMTKKEFRLHNVTKHHFQNYFKKTFVYVVMVTWPDLAVQEWIVNCFFKEIINIIVYKNLKLKYLLKAKNWMSEKMTLRQVFADSVILWDCYLQTGLFYERGVCRQHYSTREVFADKTLYSQMIATTGLFAMA